MDAHQRLSLRQSQGLTSILLHHMAIKDLETHRTSLGTKQACCLATRPSVKRTTKGRGQSSEIWVYERIQQPTRSFEVAIHCLVTAKDSQGATHHGKRRQGREEKKKGDLYFFRVTCSCRASLHPADTKVDILHTDRRASSIPQQWRTSFIHR